MQWINIGKVCVHPDWLSNEIGKQWKKLWSWTSIWILPEICYKLEVLVWQIWIEYTLMNEDSIKKGNAAFGSFGCTMEIYWWMNMVMNGGNPDWKQIIANDNLM